MITAEQHAHKLASAHADLLTAWTRTVRLRTNTGSALLHHDEEEDVLVALPDDGRDVPFEVFCPVDLCEAVESGASDATARLLAAWFWPLTWWSLRRRRARDWVLQLGHEVDNNVHFTLPHGDFSLLHLNAEWLWAPGHLGLCSLHYTLDAEAMRTWLDHAVRATTSQDDLYWSWLTPWYDAFRAQYATERTNEQRQELLLAELERYDHRDEPETTWEGWEDW